MPKYKIFEFWNLKWRHLAGSEWSWELWILKLPQVTFARRSLLSALLPRKPAFPGSGKKSLYASGGAGLPASRHLHALSFWFRLLRKRGREFWGGAASPPALPHHTEHTFAPGTYLRSRNLPLCFVGTVMPQFQLIVRLSSPDCDPDDRACVCRRPLGCALSGPWYCEDGGGPSTEGRPPKHCDLRGCMHPLY